jgi:hypothetical protein
VRLGIVIAIAVVAFAAGGALRLSTDDRDAAARKGAAVVREDRGSALPRLAGADPGPLPRPRPSPTPPSAAPVAVAPAPALAAPPASPPPPTSAPQQSPAPRDDGRFDSTDEEGTGYFESKR